MDDEATELIQDAAKTAKQKQTSDALRVKGAGEGAMEAFDPFSTLRNTSYTQDQWDSGLQFGLKKVNVGNTESWVNADGSTASPTDLTAGAFSAAAAAMGGGKNGNSAVELAKKYLGTPYVWGGSGPLGFDCSGLVQYVYKQAYGINLPRVSAQQGQSGTSVAFKNAKAGDLLFWDNSSRNNGADHVAIYMGGGKMIEAPKPGAKVRIVNVYGNPWARRVT